MLAWASLAIAAKVAAGAHAAIVVESPGGARETGLAEGDALLRWRTQSKPPRAGRFDSWSDLELLDIVESARGPVAVTLRRGGVEREVVLPARQWSARARPEAPAELVAAAGAALERLTADRAGSARRLRELAPPADPDTSSWLLARLARALADAGDHEGARQAYTEASRLAAGPFAGELLLQAGDAARRGRDLEGAEALYRDALAIWNAADRDGLGSSFALGRIGSLHGARFDLVAATRSTEQSCRIRRRRAPGSWLVANCLNQLGILAGRRNDLALAEATFLEGLELHERLGMSGVETLANLGVVARQRGDAERAEAYLRRAIALRRAEGNLLAVGVLLGNLGNALTDARRFPAALTVYDESIGLYRQRSPGSDELAQALQNRARALRAAGEIDRALADLREARAIRRFDVPAHPDEAEVALQVAEIELERGESERAAALAAQALAVESRVRPDSSHEALAAALVAETRIALGDLDGAEARYRRAIAALEAQQRRIGGGDRGLAAFRGKFAGIYHGYQELLLRRGRTRGAYELYERSRAQALLALLGDRSLALEQVVPGELHRQRLGLRRDAEEAYTALSRLPPDSGPRREELRLRLESLHAELDALAARISQGSPRAAALEAPPALSAAEIQGSLGEGTLLLAYSLGARQATLFVVGPAGEVEAHRLAKGGEALATDVRRWVELISGPRRSAEADALSAALGETLLAAAAGRLRGARRLVIVPDGALHHLSFAALREPGGKRYLVEVAPIAMEVSGSVWASEAAHRAAAGIQAAGERHVVAFGDPAYGASAVARFRRDFGRLPATRGEALAVRQTLGTGTRVFLDADATEATALRELPGSRIAHFACHAAIDEQLPLDSALLLAPAGEDAGLLQAWEILERVRLEADLVVLSACDTARGKLRGGEGSVGLVRSLRVAGARTVIASLWNVADESTAELMRRFYRRLAGGAPADEALRQAQIELLRGPVDVERGGRRLKLDASSPRHWAPFVLVGRAAG